MKTSKVYLAGAGPGDEELVTIKTINVLKQADVVVYDYLANNQLLSYCKPGCEKIYVGKKSGDHTLSQQGINELLVSCAQKYATVVRLKGGDPFVFGRGGEEALHLLQQDIAFEIIPGITSGIAAPAYAGIPVTHRGMSAGVSLISGHSADTRWQALAQSELTLVFYMGVEKLDEIATNLINAGMPESTPAAIVSYGTYPQQQSLTATLSTIKCESDKAGITSPAIIVVGQVAQLSAQLAWFEPKPLAGKRIVVTRTTERSSSLSDLLRSEGANVVELPTIVVTENEVVVDRVVRESARYNHIIFTSGYSVDIFFNGLNRVGKDARFVAGAKITALGPITASHLKKHGIVADNMPKEYTSQALSAYLISENIVKPEDTVLIPTSELASTALAQALTEHGTKVTTEAIYTNTLPDYTVEALQAAFEIPVDYVTFTSASTADNFAALARKAGIPLADIKGVSIGPVTTAAANAQGINIVVQAEKAGMPEMVEALLGYGRSLEI